MATPEQRSRIEPSPEQVSRLVNALYNGELETALKPDKLVEVASQLVSLGQARGQRGIAKYCLLVSLANPQTGSPDTTDRWVGVQYGIIIKNYNLHIVDTTIIAPEVGRWLQDYDFSGVAHDTLTPDDIEWSALDT